MPTITGGFEACVEAFAKSNSERFVCIRVLNSHFFAIPYVVLNALSER